MNTAVPESAPEGWRKRGKDGKRQQYWKRGIQQLQHLQHKVWERGWDVEK